MKTIHVYDPPMCCSTGVCGPSVDPKLPQFAADLDWLKSQGVSVERFNLAQQPAEFAQNAEVKKALEAKGTDALPLILADGQVASIGTYPSRRDLAAYAGIEVPEITGVWSPAVEELVAIGASIACGCMPCLKYHTDNARALGVTDEEMAKAVAMGQSVKETPARLVLELADRYLNGKVNSATIAPTDCVPSSSTQSSGKCCG